MAYSKDLRRRVIKFVREGGKRLEAARLFAVDRKTIYNWLHDKTSPQNSPATRRRKINKNKLLEHIQKNPNARQRDCAALFGVSHVAIHKAFKCLGIIKKNNTLQRKEMHTKDKFSP